MKKDATAINWSTLANTLFVFPAVCMFLMFNLYPYYKVIVLSFMKYNGFSGGGGTFVGLSHYKDIVLANKWWWTSFVNAGIVTFLALTLQNGLALILAWIVDRGIKGGQVYRSIFFIPPILSGIVVGLIWNWILQGDIGLLNRFLGRLGLDAWLKSWGGAWLAHPRTALPTLAFIHMWKGFGWGFIILLAGLQGVPRELYEAARVDGAGEWRIFWKITMPLMIPVFVLVSVLTVLGSMQLYDLVITTTQGGPAYHTEVPMKMMIDEISPKSRLGYASAMGLVFGFILLVVSVVQLRFSKKVRAD